MSVLTLHFQSPFGPPSARVAPPKKVHGRRTYFSTAKLARFHQALFCSLHRHSQKTATAYRVALAVIKVQRRKAGRQMTHQPQYF